MDRLIQDCKSGHTNTRSSSSCLLGNANTTLSHTPHLTTSVKAESGLRMFASGRYIECTMKAVVNTLLAFLLYEFSQSDNVSQQQKACSAPKRESAMAGGCAKTTHLKRATVKIDNVF